MSTATMTLREHLASVPDARLVPPAQREEDIGQFSSLDSDAVAVDAPLVEDRPFVPITIPSTELSGFTHFLDGTQRSWRVAFVGIAPIYLAYTSAGLLARRDREVLPPED